MVPSQYEIFAKQYAMAAEHVEIEATIERTDGRLDIGQFCFKYLQNHDTYIEENEGYPDETDVGHECGISKHTSSKVQQEAIAAAIRSVSRTEMFNANYLIGKTSVCIILPESNGSTENWTSEEEDIAISEVIYAYNVLSELAHNLNIDVNWVYEIHTSIPVGEEPIEHVRPYWSDPLNGWTWGWMGEALNSIGVSGTEWNALFNNANRLRQQYKTDWGITYFVVKNETQPGFPDGALGYTRQYWIDGTTETFRAPFAVSVLYRYAGSPYTAHKTIAHETLHIFGAADEYDGAPDCGGTWHGIPLPPTDCDHGHGYLNYPNYNCERCTTNQGMCIMRTSNEAYYLCYHTLRHIGWTDSDGDGHPDAIDLNNDLWQKFSGLQPGDMFRVFTLDNDLVRNICVTETKSDSGEILYDCLNYQSQQIAYSLFKYTINNGPEHTFVPNYDDPGIIPVIQSISYLPETHELIWEIVNSLCYLDLEIWGTDLCTGIYGLLAKPQWNKYHRESAGVVDKSQDVSNIFCDTCTAVFRTWRPDGVNGGPYEFAYSNPSSDSDSDSIADPCDNCPDVYNPLQEDSNGDGVGDACCCQNRGNVDGIIGYGGPVDVGDLSYLVAFLFQGGPLPPCIEEGNVDGVTGVGGPIDVGDLSYLVAFLFQGGPPSPICLYTLK